MDDVILCHLHYLSLSLQMVERKGNLFSLHHYRCSVPLNWIADFLVFQSWSIFHGHWSESIDHALIRLSEGSKRSTVIVRTKVTGTSLSLNAHVAHQSGHCVFNWRRDDRTRLCTSQMENVHEDDTAPNWPMERSRFEFNVSQREREVGTNAFGLQRFHLEDIQKNTLNLHWLQNSPVYMKLHAQWYLKTKFLHWPWRPQRVLL